MARPDLNGLGPLAAASLWATGRARGWRSAHYGYAGYCDRPRQHGFTQTRGQRQPFQGLIATEGYVDAVEGCQEASQHALEARDDLREARHDTSAVQVSNVMDHHLEAEERARLMYAFNVSLPKFG